jgi:DNA invertase Pin-like site-specific DNA recombinase
MSRYNGRPLSGTLTAPAPVTKRCAIYTRKSTTNGLEQEFNSLDAQREACLGYIQRQPGWVAVEEAYDDGGFTGANTDRPAFQRLMADVDAKKVDVIVVYKVDRLSRSLLDFAKVMERLSAAGASFVSVTQNFSTADAMGRLTLNVVMSFAEFEREMISERTRDKVAASRRKGMWTGGVVPFGYETLERKLVVIEREAAVVREAYATLLEEHRATAAVRILNERGLFPREGRGPDAGQGRWTRTTLKRLLRNPLYGGLVHYEGKLYPGEHVGIVSEETYNRALEILQGKTRTLRFTGNNYDYLLRGLLRCGPCNAAMTTASSRKADRHYRYYRCVTREKKGAAACKTRQLSAPAIERYVVDRIIEATRNGAISERIQRELDERIRRHKEQMEAMMKELPTRIAQSSANANRYAEELTRVHGAARHIIERKLEASSDELAYVEEQLARAQREFQALQAVGSDAREILIAAGKFEAIWEILSIENRGRLLRALVEKVVVHEAAGTVAVHLVDLSAVVSTQPMESAA